MQAQLAQGVADGAGIVEVILHVVPPGAAAFRGENRLGGPLHGIGHAVALGGQAAPPHLAKSAAIEAARHHGIAAAHAGKARQLGEGAAFDGALPGSLAFIDAAGHLRGGDEGAVCRVIEDQSAILPGPVHIALQFPQGQRHAGGVIGEAQIQGVHIMAGQGRHETVLPHAGQIFDLGPEAVLILTCPARHDVAVHIDGIDGIGHRHPGLGGQQFLQGGGVGLGAVGDIDLVHAQCHAPGLVEMLADGCAQKLIALLRTVALKALGGAHLQGGVRQGAGHDPGQRTGHVPNAQADDLPSGMAFLIGVDPRRHLLEEIA